MSTPYDVKPVPERLDWRAAANCATADPEIFTPDKGGSKGTCPRGLVKMFPSWSRSTVRVAWVAVEVSTGCRMLCGWSRSLTG